MSVRSSRRTLAATSRCGDLKQVALLLLSCRSPSLSTGCGVGVPAAPAPRATLRWLPLAPCPASTTPECFRRLQLTQAANRSWSCSPICCKAATTTVGSWTSLAVLSCKADTVYLSLQASRRANCCRCGPILFFAGDPATPTGLAIVNTPRRIYDPSTTKTLKLQVGHCHCCLGRVKKESVLRWASTPHTVTGQCPCVRTCPAVSPAQRNMRSQLCCLLV